MDRATTRRADALVRDLQKHFGSNRARTLIAGKTEHVNPKGYPMIASHHKTGSVLGLGIGWSLSKNFNCEEITPVPWVESWGWPIWRNMCKAPCVEVLMHWSG